MTYTTLYPGSARPHHGLFVEERLRRIVAGGDLSAHVVAPVPWFPSAAARFGRFAAYARAPRDEERHGITITHPRYLSLPGLGRDIDPWLLAAGTYRTLKRRRADYDLIDAQYFYPDGAAAALLGRWLNKPVVITARGSDINLFSGLALPRRWILWAAQRSAAIITVSQALKQRLMALGVADSKISTLRNGVDLTRFRPGDQAALRRRLGLSGRVILMVGNLVPEKGHARVLEALTQLPEVTLLLIGAGPLQGALEAQARQRGIAARVRWLGALPQSELTAYYNAADVLVLASEREGMPNVVLEALACGTPVVAAAVGGVPELITAPAAGLLVHQPTPAAFAAALHNVLAVPPTRQETRQHSEQFGWDETIMRQRALYRGVIS